MGDAVGPDWYGLACSSKRLRRFWRESWLFLALEGLLAVLDPDAVIRIDGAARIAGGAADAADTPRELRGASTWAKQLIAMSRGLRFVQPALINGSVGLILAPGGQLSRVLTFTFTNAKIARLDVIGDPAHLRVLNIAVL
jgi:RNA polymerase sigma-70 factor, ECF subfamily